MKEFLPVPVKLFVGPRATKKGGELTMVIGFLPKGFTDKDKIITAKIIFAEQKEHSADKYYGWLAEDILQDGIQIDKPEE